MPSLVEAPRAEARANLSLSCAVVHLRDDGLVAYPTETVWGLAARAMSHSAVARLRAWKHRGRQPISLLMPDPCPRRLESLGLRVSPLARKLIEEFWPGPVTLVLASRGARTWPVGIAGAQGAIGVRCSSHPAASALARRADRAGIGPLTATSFNRAGQPAALRKADARRIRGRGVAAPRLLEFRGAPPSGRVPSSVVDLAGDAPIVLRRGVLAQAVQTRIEAWSESRRAGGSP